MINQFVLGTFSFRYFTVNQFTSLTIPYTNYFGIPFCTFELPTTLYGQCIIDGLPRITFTFLISFIKNPAFFASLSPSMYGTELISNSCVPLGAANSLQLVIEPANKTTRNNKNLYFERIYNYIYHCILQAIKTSIRPSLYNKMNSLPYCYKTI